METNKLKELAKRFFENKQNPTEEDLYEFLVDNEYKIAQNYESSCHMEDIKYELEEQGYDFKNINNELLGQILYRFEDKLGDYGSECGWRTILDNTIEWFEEDLEEYKLEGNE